MSEGKVNAILGMIAVLAIVIFSSVIITTLNATREATQGIREGQECIIGTLLFTPEARSETNGIIIDDLCGFDQGTIDGVRETLGIEVPQWPQP